MSKQPTSRPADSSQAPTILSRDERVRLYGVDCVERLVWNNWVPGGEYTKHLVLKNLHPKLQVLQYRASRLKAIFFMQFPEPITLTAGMQHSVEIRFRPSEQKEYLDYFEIVTPQGSFYVELAAHVPYTSVEIPSKFDFNFCPVNVTSTATLEMHNTGTLPVRFKWDIVAPFSIDPPQGEMEPQKKQTLTVKFTPVEASALIATALCHVNDQRHVLKLSGIGKFPYISCPNTIMDFGTVLTGLKQSRIVTVSNRALVDAEFTIKRTDKDIENPFVFIPSSGIIPKEGSVKIQILYKPMTTGMSYSNDFLMQTPGGNQLKWRMYGQSANPDASLSVSSVNFGDVDVDSKATPEKVIVLTNPSQSRIDFSFLDIDAPGGAFFLNPNQGTVGPSKCVNITIRFQPHECINYYRRLLCTISNQIYLLYVDILGTGYNKNSRPPPFNQKHVNAFRSRCSYGLATITPDDLQRLSEEPKEGGPPMDPGEASARRVLAKSLDGLDPTTAPKALFQTYFLSSRSTQGTPFCLDQDHIEFAGRGDTVVYVKNLTSAKATATWALPMTQPPQWSVQPQSQNIPAFGSAPFSVRCLTSQPASNTLECYISYKTMRSFRLASDINYTPPICLPLLCINPARAENVAAKLSMGRRHVAFPPCHKGDSVEQVATLYNDGDTAVHFRFMIEGVRAKVKDPNEDEFSNSDVFVVKPSFGVVPPKSRHLIALRFSPKRDTRYVAVAKAMLNYSTAQSVSVKLLGEAYVASVEVPNEGVVHFRPAAVGCSTQRTYKIENPTRIVLRYEWQVPERWKEIFIVNPLKGILTGNAIAAIDFQFKPDKERKFTGNIPLLLTPLVDEGIDETQMSQHRQIITCMGEGCFGGLTMEPSTLTFDTVVVGQSISREITLFNSSMCDMSYLLQCRNTNSDVEGVLTFNNKSGTMHARSHETIQLTFTPRERSVNTFVVYCLFGDKAVQENDGREVTLDDLYKLPNCTVTAKGEYAMLQVVDIRSLFISKAHIWEQFSITNLNRLLAADVTPSDKESDSFSFKQVLQSVACCSTDFASDVVSTPPTKVVICFENPTCSTVSFRYWMPDESDVISEKWHHEEPPDVEDLKRESILDDRVFTITPREGAVPAGGRINITFSFHHKEQGVYELPVIMQLTRGKRVALLLKGTTLSPSDQMLYIPSPTHEFQPVAIGDMDPILQYFELRNLSHQTVQYELDYKALKTLRDTNYDFPIFQCLNSYGTIPPVSSVMLRWYFRPLEAKEYEISVPIIVQGGKRYQVTFRGQGYHPRKVLTEDLHHMEDTEFLSFPRLPYIVDPSVPISLSLDTITFGRIPCHSLHRAFLILNNYHTSDTFAFEWFATIHSGDQIIEVEPPMGTVAPGGRVVCKVNLYAGSTIHIVDCNIQCHVVNDDLRNRRLAAREAVEHENKMRLDIPAATQTAVSQSTDQLMTKTKQRVPITTIPARYQTTLRLKRRLQQLLEAVDINEVDENSEDLIFVDVQPIALDLRLQFRVMPLEVYRSLYSDKYAALMLPTVGVYSQHVDAPTIPLEPTATLEALEASRDVPLHMARTDDAPTESALVAEVLQDVLRSLVHDPGVLEALEDAPEEDVPLFSDYCRLAKTSTPPRTPAATYKEELAAFRRREHEDSLLRNLMQHGEVQSLVEEVLDSMLFGVLSDAAMGGAEAPRMLCPPESMQK